MERAVRPCITYPPAIVAFLAAVAVWPWWINYATAPRWVVVSIGISLCLWLHRSRPTGTVMWLAVCLGWAALSGLWSPSQPDWAQEVWTLALLIGAVQLGQTADYLQAARFYTCFGAGVCVSVTVAIAQYTGHHVLPTAGELVTGLFFNQNLFGEVLFPALVLASSWDVLFALVLLVGIFLVPFRAGWLGLGLAATLALATRRRWKATGAVVVAAGAAFAWLAASKGTASLDVRLVTWNWTLHHLAILGNGAGSFFSEAALAPTPQRMGHPHNEILLYLFELGVGAIPLLTVMARAIIGELRHERAAFIVLCTEALFGFPLHLPATILLGGYLMGRLCRHGDQL